MRRFRKADISTASYTDKFRLKGSQNNLTEFKLPDTIKSRDGTRQTKSNIKVDNYTFI